jgi:xylan 1,4-beta-xylosidase
MPDCLNDSRLHLKSGSYRLKIHRTGFRANDAYSAYIDMGLDQLRDLTRDLPEIDRAIKVAKSGSYEFSLAMHSNDVVLVKLERAEQ